MRIKIRKTCICFCRNFVYNLLFSCSRHVWFRAHICYNDKDDHNCQHIRCNYGLISLLIETSFVKVSKLLMKITKFLDISFCFSHRFNMNRIVTQLNEV